MEMQALGRRAPRARPSQRPLLRHVSVNTGATPLRFATSSVLQAARLHPAQGSV